MEQHLTQLRRTSWLTWALRIVLTVVLVAVLAFIFSNATASGETSAEQSYAVTEQVQEVARIVAPESEIAKATGEDFIRLHINVRTAAHFCQFALLGAVAFWCYLSYTRKKLLSLIPILGTAAVAVIDEFLQIFSDGRAWELTDILVDIAGGMAGIVFALLVFWVLFAVYRRIKNKEKN